LGTSVPFSCLPCLVNGDDILFRTNKAHYELWKKRVASIGFDLSIGKNYIHPRVLTINSTCFHYVDRFEKIGFCNYGLLSGTSKLGGSRGEVREKAVDLLDAYTRSVGGARDKALAFSKFLTRNKSDIMKVTCRGRYNLFLPRLMGGFEFPLYEGIDCHVTRFQKCLAKLIKQTGNYNIVGFTNDIPSNAVSIRETKNPQKIMVGMGPLREGERLFDPVSVTSVNSSYLPDSNTKFFTNIPEHYDPQKLFPFQLKESKFRINWDQMIFRRLVQY
jgi:hypothetical protein